MYATTRRWTISLVAAALLMLPLTASAQTLVNINTASAEELQTLPGIGATKARAIVDHRVANGPFSSIDAITNVTGVGQGTLSNIRSLITVGDGAVAAQDALAEEGANFEDDPIVDLTDDEGSSIAEPTTSDQASEPAVDTPPAQDDVATPPAPAGSGTCAGGLININTASAAQFQTLPGIGTVKSQAIVDYRTSIGSFTSIEQLDDVSGVGPATMNNIRSLVCVQ